MIIRLRSRSTHVFTTIHAFLMMVFVLGLGGITLSAIISLILWFLLSVPLTSLSKRIPESALFLAGVLTFAVIYSGCMNILTRFVVEPLSPLPTLLYLRFCLFVPATWQDARNTSFLFDASLRGKWYPLTEIRKYPKHLRRDALYKFAESIRGRH